MVAFLSARVESGELVERSQTLGHDVHGFHVHARHRKDKFPDSELHSGDSSEALRFYIDVFLNGVRSKS